jgi:hypothetical protein
MTATRADWLEQFGDLLSPFRQDLEMAASEVARRSSIDMEHTDKVHAGLRAIVPYLVPGIEDEETHWRRLREREHGYLLGQVRDLIAGGYEGEPGREDGWRKLRRLVLRTVMADYLARYAFPDRAEHLSLDDERLDPEQLRPRGKTVWLRGGNTIGNRDDLERQWQKAREIVESMDDGRTLRAIMETDSDGSSTGLGFKEPAAELLGAAPSTFRRAFRKDEKLFLIQWSVTELSEAVGS